MTQTSKKSGFTLVELAIVLVIIGLIVGGVLAGSDLIKAASIKSAVSQIQTYDTSVNTFRNKYNGLPGDLQNCVNFFTAADCVTGAAAATVQGDSVLQDFGGTQVLMSGEVTQFWRNLYNAGLIPDPITSTTTVSANAAVTAANMPTVLPNSKLGNGQVIAYSVSSTVPAAIYPTLAGTNVFRIASVTAIAGTGAPTLANNLTPLEAFQVDVKKDDGIPNAGQVQGTNTITNFNIATEAASGNGAALCLSAANAYNTSSANSVQNVKLCNLLMRASF